MHVPGVEDFLVPGYITGLAGIIAALVKLYEYTHQAKSMRGIDLIMWITIITRAGLGIYYLSEWWTQMDYLVTEQTVIIRLLVTLLLIADTLRGLRRITIQSELNRLTTQINGGNLDE